MHNHDHHAVIVSSTDHIVVLFLPSCNPYNRHIASLIYSIRDTPNSLHYHYRLVAFISRCCCMVTGGTSIHRNWSSALCHAVSVALVKCMHAPTPLIPLHDVCFGVPWIRILGKLVTAESEPLLSLDDHKWPSDDQSRPARMPLHSAGAKWSGEFSMDPGGGLVSRVNASPTWLLVAFHALHDVHESSVLCEQMRCFMR